MSVWNKNINKKSNCSIFTTFTLNELIRLSGLFKSFNFKLLVIFNNSGIGFFVHSCHVVGLHGNHVNGNLDGHNLTPYIKIIVC